MEQNTDFQPRKKKKGLKIVLIILLAIIAIPAITIAIVLSTVDDTKVDPSEIEGNIDFNSQNWIDAADDAAKDYLNQYYNGGNSLSYDLKYERTWFVDVEYDYGQDDFYEADDFTHGYYVCEGAFRYDIPGDGKNETVPVNYTTSVFVTDNANGYRWSLRSITLTYDGVEIDSYKNAKFFSE